MLCHQIKIILINMWDYPAEIPIGKSKSITIKDTASNKNINIAIFNISGRFYAISGSCIHKGRTSLAKVFSTEIL